jgi:hypothetical protein
MSLVHYVLVQGLGVTKDWNRKAHDNASFVSCVHMRNVSHMSLGLISLLLHTCCEKAMIPANSGHLLLPLPSPDFNAQSPARIEYDSRLHVDTSMHLMQGASDNVLAVDARLATADNWRLVNVNGASVLLYASVASSTLFPFPPEAVAHVACFFKYMALAHKRFVESKHAEQQRTADEHLFALAMLQLGASIRKMPGHRQELSAADQRRRRHLAPRLLHDAAASVPGTQEEKRSRLRRAAGFRHPQKRLADACARREQAV